MSSLADDLAARTGVADLVEPAGDALRCVACAHRCVLAEGDTGTCGVRFVRGGELRAPRGYVSAVTLDPIEKKPFFHAAPGARCLTFGMLGCDFRCAFCQNWFVSQAIRDPEAGSQPEPVTAEELANTAVEEGCAFVVSSFNEPLITAEWAAEVFRASRAAGLATGIVSNGHGTPQVLEYLLPHVDVVKVDLKAMDEATYRGHGGTLAGVLDSLERIAASTTWLEVVTVLIPGQNDSPAEVSAMAEFLARLGRDIPWHLHGFRPDYKLTTVPPTPPETLLRAAAVGREVGLRFVYPGLAAGLPKGCEDTRCASCDALLVERGGLRARTVRLDAGACPECGWRLPGFGMVQDAGTS